MKIGAERVGQHQHWAILRPFDFNMDDATVVGFDVRHSCPPVFVVLLLLKHDPEKWQPVFGKDHAQTKS
jgi:hypothetical protein